MKNQTTLAWLEPTAVYGSCWSHEQIHNKHSDLPNSQSLASFHNFKRDAVSNFNCWKNNTIVVNILDF
jgi:hypothetical protein